MPEIQVYRYGGGYDDDPRVEFQPYSQRYVLLEDHERIVKEFMEKVNRMAEQIRNEEKKP
jgi:hypothetical protein